MDPTPYIRIEKRWPLWPLENHANTICLCLMCVMWWQYMSGVYLTREKRTQVITTTPCKFESRAAAHANCARRH